MHRAAACVHKKGSACGMVRKKKWSPQWKIIYSIDWVSAACSAAASPSTQPRCTDTFAKVASQSQSRSAAQADGFRVNAKQRYRRWLMGGCHDRHSQAHT